MMRTDCMKMTDDGRRLAASFGLRSTADIIRTLGDRVVAWSRTTDTIRLGDGDHTIYVKRYRYPRWKHRVRGMFRGTLFGEHRARREFRALEKLRRIGAPVVRPLGWGHRRRFGFVTLSYLITEGEPGAMSLAHFANEHLLRRDDASVRVTRLKLVRELAGTIRRLHEGGLIHGNLFLRNILVRPRPGGEHEFIFLDAVRVRRVSADDPLDPLIIGDLAGLASIGPDVCRRAEVLAFAKEYLGVRELGHRERAWIRRVIDAGRTRRDHERYRLRVEKYFRREATDAAPKRTSA